jgi:hypothetical protein
MKEKTIKVLKVEPYGYPEIMMLGNDLTSMQNAVDGLIEFVYLYDSIGLLINEEGKLISMTPNRRLGNDIFVGTFYVVGFKKDGDCRSLTDNEVVTYEKMFHEPEVIDPREVEKTIKFEFYSW